MTSRFLFSLLGAVLLLSACSETQYAAHLAKNIGGNPTPNPTQEGNFKVGKPYNVMGQTYHPRESYDHVETGIASWYGPGFHGKRTANGEKFDKGELTAAHRTLQMPSLIRVTNLDNGRVVTLRVNDRGPFSRGRVLDVSERGAELLGFKNIGTAKVKIEVLESESRQLAEMARQGKDTRGFEVAANTRGRVQPASAPAESTYKPEPIQTVDVAPVGRVQGHATADGRFMPDQTVQHVPVQQTGIYVQAGAFSNEANAVALSSKLASIGPSRVYHVNVGGRSLYRVRLGPYEQVASADSALNRVVGTGTSDALIVVD